MCVHRALVHTGILAAIGGPVLKPGGLTYNILFATNAMLKAAQCEGGLCGGGGAACHTPSR